MKRLPHGLTLVIACTLVYLVLDLVGARAHLGVLSGTRAQSHLDVVLAVLYGFTWFGLVLVVPVLLLASVLRVGAAAGGNIRSWIRSWKAPSSTAR